MAVFLKFPERSGSGRVRRPSRAAGWIRRLYGQRRRLATGLAAGLAVAFGYHVVFGHNGLTAYGQKRLETHSLEQQMRDLTQENEELKGHVGRLQTDPNAIEHEAREQLHYTRPGEVIITLPPERRAATAGAGGAP